MKAFLVKAAVVLVIGAAAWLSVGGGLTAGTPTEAPEFVGVSRWVNGKEVKMSDQRGKVVVVHFFTTGCINCVHNYPHYKAWQDRYKDEKRFVLVGVHTAEFDTEKDAADLAAKLTQNRLTFPVAVDDEAKTWKAWGNHAWPCVYVVDKAGRVRHKWEGELRDAGYNKLTRQIDDLLAEPAPK